MYVLDRTISKDYLELHTSTYLSVKEKEEEGKEDLPRQICVENVNGDQDDAMQKPSLPFILSTCRLVESFSYHHLLQESA